MNKQILIIDDEDWYMEPILDRLDYMGIGYEYAETIFEGLELFNNNAFEIIIIDMKLPFGSDFGINPDNYPAPGIFLLEEIRIKNEYIPIICYTVLNNPDISSRIKYHKACHIPKAHEHPDVLFDEIKKHIHLK